MAVNQIAVDYAYGISDALIPLAPRPIIAQRDPGANDLAQLGTTWVNKVDSSVWVLASVTNNSANWTTSPASGIGSFTSVAVNPGNVNLVAGNLTLGAGNVSLTAGNLNVGGSLTVGGAIAFSGSIDFTSASVITVTSTLNSAPSIDIEANGGTSEQILIHSTQGTSANAISLSASAGGITFTAATSITQSAGSTFALNSVGALSLNSSGAAINIGNNAVAQAINMGTGAAARTIAVGNITGATAVNINAGTGGFNVASAGIATIAVVTTSSASPTATATINANLGSATFTGFTTAAAAAQQFTITNSLVTATSHILVSISNEGANDAKMTVARVSRGTGSFIVTAVNNGAVALNGNLTVTFFILS